MIVRPFGLLGPRYDVTERGALYCRLAWASALSAIVLMLILPWIETNPALHVAIPLAALCISVFVTLRFVALTMKHGVVYTYDKANPDQSPAPQTPPASTSS